MEIANEKHEYMENFKKYRMDFIYGNMDLIIERLVNRGEQFNTGSLLMHRLSANDNPVHKMLDININVTLPSLLHINQQICNDAKVSGYNPLSSQYLFDRAVALNNPFTERPKEALVNLSKMLPMAIKNRKDKMGFPIPFHKWNTFSNMVKEAIERSGESFSGINRRSWGIFMIERWEKLFTK